jgi:hypothetical protein
MDPVKLLLGEIEPQFDLSSPLNFLMSVYKSTDVPLHTRLRAAAEACKYSLPQLKAVAQVKPGDMSAILDAARARANGARLLHLVPPAAALPHPASELKPTNGFKRRF